MKSNLVKTYACKFFSMIVIIWVYTFNRKKYTFIQFFVFAIIFKPIEQQEADQILSCFDFVPLVTLN